MVNPLVAAAVPGLISAGSSLLGKFLGGDPKDDAKDMAKYVGSNAIQWRVNDANKAGVHPLYALGASVINNAPSVVGDAGDSSWVENMGQGLARSADAMLSTQGRSTALVERLALERAGLENELLKARIASERSQVAPGVNRSPLIAGQGDSLSVGGMDRFPIPPGATPAQTWEDWFGEIGGEAFGGLPNTFVGMDRYTRDYEKKHGYTIQHGIARAPIVALYNAMRNWVMSGSRAYQDRMRRYHSR